MNYVANSNSPHRLTLATPDDNALVRAVRLAVDMWEEAPEYAHLPLDVDRIIEFAYHARGDPQTFVAVVERGDTCHGFIVGSIAHMQFCDALYAFDRMLYVTPTSRGSVAGRMLITAFEHWAKLHSAVHVTLGVSTGVHVERTEAFYNKLGYRTIGAVTRKEI